MISDFKKKKLDAECRTYVVGRGKRTGHEHLTGYRAGDGKRLGTMTNGRVDAVGFPPTMRAAALDKRGRVVVHHNHPRGTSLSMMDLFNLHRLPGTLEVHAHGHTKQWYCATSRRERRYENLLIVAEEAFRDFVLNPGGTQVPEELHNHLVNLALDECKVIVYKHRLDARLSALYSGLSSDVRAEFERGIVNAVNAERSRS